MTFQGREINSTEIYTGSNPTPLELFGLFTQMTCGKFKEEKLGFYGLKERNMEFLQLSGRPQLNQKDLEGWGLKNIHHFRKALAFKNLWRIMSTDGI